MSTVTTSTPARPTAKEPTPEKTTAPFWACYIGAMLYFLGAALIAGGVVHYPIDPPRYGHPHRDRCFRLRPRHRIQRVRPGS